MQIVATHTHYEYDVFKKIIYCSDVSLAISTCEADLDSFLANSYT
jgi:hypothetical protein